MALPYLPAGREILYVLETDDFMQSAKAVAQKKSTNKKRPVGVVVVSGGKIIGSGANVSLFHKWVGCMRKLVYAPTGEYYALCPGCSPTTHAEQTALRDVKKNGLDASGADIYLWGHWWCCESCWQKMIEAGIRNVYLVQDAEKRFKN